MPALPLKDWLYGGAIIVLLIAFGLYTSHERGIGEAKIKAQDAALAAAAKQHNLDVQALADKKTAGNGDTYVATTHAAIPDSPHVVCNRPAAAHVVPEAASNTGVPDATAHSAAATPVDIGPPIDTAGRNADALITALQNQVRILVDAMNGVTAP